MKSDIDKPWRRVKSRKRSALGICTVSQNVLAMSQSVEHRAGVLL